ncbi:hypothetical protein BRARA_I05054, partial [Brassica rapa]
GGWVVRDSNGIFVTTGHAEGKIVYSALEAEFQALLMAIQFCWCQGYTRVIFEGDNKKMIDILKSKALQFGLYNWVREIRWWINKLGEVDLMWTRRQNNMMADGLAKAYLPANIYFQSYYYIPKFVTNHLHKDYVSSNLY